MNDDQTRSIAVLTLCAPLLVAGPAFGQSDGTVAIRILDEPIENLRAYSDGVLAASSATAPTNALADRSAATTDVLLLPYFESDPNDPNGVNTLFALRNETDRELPVRILYVGVLGAVEQQVQEISLPANALRTINLHDVHGLPADADGVARGLVILGAIGQEGSSRPALRRLLLHRSGDRLRHRQHAC